jgi:serine/threonine-protein kinase
MGEVYEAVRIGSGEPAAVKLLSRNVLSNPERVHRFIREAKIAAAFDTPHVVRVLEVGEPDAPVPFIAMELLRGEDLAQTLRRRRRLSLEEMLRLIQQVAAGLDVAHAAGVVHRDLKPQNIFLHGALGGDLVWKVLDFGVSRLGSTAGTLTQGQAIGTPGYMAPEQARGRPVDRRADVFALAVIAYRALTGRPPFGGRDVPQILHNVVYTVPPRPSELVALDPQVDLALAIALAKRREDRFDTAGELARELAAAAQGGLSDELVSRGERLTSRAPWGASLP